MKDYALIECIQKIENESSVQQWKIDNFHIWPLVRIRAGAVYDVKWALGENGYKKKTTFFQSDKWEKYFKIIRNRIISEAQISIFDSSHQKQLSSCDVVMLCDGIDRTLLLPNGEWFNHTLDPIYAALKSCGYQIVIFEKVGSEAKYPRWSQSYLLNWMLISAGIKRQLHYGKMNSMKMEEQIYEKVKKEFSLIGIDLAFISLDWIMEEYLLIQFLKNEFVEKLKIITPKIVIVSCWYSTEAFALCAAAHMLNIPVVDIQHGVAGGSGIHYAYTEWKNLPQDGYECMPDYMWCWNQSDYDMIAHWGKKTVIPILGGRAINLFFSNPFDKLSVYYHNTYESEFGKKRPYILFTLGVYFDYPDWIVDFINETDDYTWLIRVHPGNRYPDVLKKFKTKNNIIWDNVASFPLEILLQHVAVHITFFSSVVLDGEECGCPSIVLSSVACEMYASQIERGIVHYAKNRKELEQEIRRIVLKHGGQNGYKCRAKELYDRGRDGIQQLIRIMEEQ